jgi:4-alpha-glucanotransferase
VDQPDPQAWGVLPGYHDVHGRWRPASGRAADDALRAMAATRRAPPPTNTWVVTADERVELPEPALLRTEDGGSERVEGTLAPVPLGYHTLEFADEAVRLIVSPGRCPRPARRAWGWSVQLYATRSRDSWGIGDLADLAQLGRWAAAQGASMALVNPLHAPGPGPSPEASPYFPSSRLARNPLYLRIEDIEGARDDHEILALAEAARAANAGRIIDRAAVWELKLAALERLWPSRGAPTEAPAPFAGFATFSALAERHGPDWRQWPPELRRADGPAVARFAARGGAERVAFHGWVQRLLDDQLAAAAAALPLIGDLAIGADPGGADAWAWQDVLAEGVSVGAPPDDFAPDGQDWGFPPFDPWRLRAAHYQPFIDVVRAALDHMSGVRIDHVAGLFRQFWVTAAGEGVYVRYPWADLLRIIALESHRAGAVVIGEDLGTVEDEARVALAATGVLSYRLLWFENEPPANWPELALAAVTTHDLPTIAGMCTGSDAPVESEALLQRLARASGRDPRGQVGEVVLGAYRALAESPCLLAAVTFEDALSVPERPNVPGATGEHPNWCLALPQPLEAIEGDERAARLAAVMRDAGR